MKLLPEPHHQNFQTSIIYLPSSYKKTQISILQIINLYYLIGVGRALSFAMEHLLRQYPLMSSYAWNHLGAGFYQ